jgi:hypothetical protein
MIKAIFFGLKWVTTLPLGGYKYRGLVLRDGGWAWGQQPYPVKKKIVEKPPRNSAGF